jgi:hypothetical protein
MVFDYFRSFGMGKMNSQVHIFNDGSVTVNRVTPPPYVKYAIVKMLDNPGQTFPFEVMAAAVNDQDIPTRLMKGDKIPCRQWFNFMSMIMTAPALRWALEPHVLFVNDRYKGDSAWPDYDPQGNAPSDAEPISECIYYPCNFVAYDGRLGDWFRLLSYKNTEPPTSPFTDNWYRKPWLWGKAQARNQDGNKVINVGAGLDVYLPLIRKTTNAWMHLSQLELLPALPYMLEDGRIITSYELTGCNVIGLTESGSPTFLRKVTGTTMIEPHTWHLQTRAVIAPEGF